MSADLATEVVPNALPQPRMAPRWWRGLMSCLAFLVFPLGWFLPARWFRRVSDEHLDQGLVIILPGVEGRGFLSFSILTGLSEAGVPYGLEVFDWTTGWKPLVLYHLRAWRRNQRVAQQVAERIVGYQRDYPNRPVWIVGHSGGGGMALLTAAALPEDVRVTGIVLLAPAVSPQFDVASVLGKVEKGIWNYYSWFDWFFVGLGTSIFGCFDGRHGPAAGMVGFQQLTETVECSVVSASKAVFEQTRHTWRMLLQFHAGGHFGCAHRVFVAESIAPLMLPKR